MKILLLLLLLTVPAFAQDTPEGPRPDRWRGMVINETTPTAAIEVFGKPDSDKIDRLRVFDVDGKILSQSLKEKDCRHLEWKKLDGVKQAILSFKNDKLVRIFLWLPKEKAIAAASLPGTYKLDFRAKTDSMTEGLFGPIGGSPLSGRKHVTYPSVYSLIAQTDKTWVTASIDNASWKHVLVGDGDTSSGTGAFPGKAITVQIVSRTLENRDGADVLK
jgi:hypothetical protein